MWATQEICWTCKIGNITNCVLHLAFFEHYIQYTIHPPYLFLEISFTYCNYNYSKFKKNTKRGRGFPLCATRDLAILAQVLREGRRRGGGGGTCVILARGSGDLVHTAHLVWGTVGEGEGGFPFWTRKSAPGLLLSWGPGTSALFSVHYIFLI